MKVNNSELLCHELFHKVFYRLFIYSSSEMKVSAAIWLRYLVLHAIFFLLQPATYCVVGWTQGSTRQTAGPILILLDVAHTITSSKFQAIIFRV